MRDLLIKSGMLIDGTGTPAWSADIAIANGIIVEIGSHIEGEFVKTIDAKSLFVTPGFIDPHTHSDLAFLRDRRHTHAVMQGITTEVFGLCGMGLAPLPYGSPYELMRFTSGIFGSIPEGDCDWTSFADYFKRHDGCAINVMCAAGHNALRVSAAGYSDRKLNEQELKTSKSAMHKAMEDGAVGFSTGLSYYPCGWSDTKELIELCSIVKAHDGVFLVHKRAGPEYPTYDDDAEVIEIVQHTGVRTHILHYKTGLSNVGKPESLILPYQEALDEGYDISFELYPYHTGCGYGPVLLPPWAQVGGFEKIIDVITNEKSRPQLLRDVSRYYEFYRPQDGAPCVFTHLKNHAEYEGLSFENVAHKRKQTVVEMIVDMLVESELEFGWRGTAPSTEVSKQLYHDIMWLINHPCYTVGSDAIPLGSHPHPRMFGAFAKMLRLVREFDYPLEKFVRKVTSFTAQRLGIADRGTLAVGKCADIAVFDFVNVKDEATWDNPCKLASGMKHVIVNGVAVVLDGKPTQATAGNALSPSRK